MQKVIIESDLQGKRADEALFALGIVPSRSKTKPFFKQGKVFLNGKTCKPHDWLKEGDVLEYETPEVQEIDLPAQDIPLDIVFEDDDVIVINKPAGLVVHPGNGHEDQTLVNALLHHIDSLSAGSDPKRPGIVHRIDKDTTGLLVCAKNDAAFSFLAAQLSDHTMHREYLALVKGIILEDDGKIDAPIGRSKKNPTKNAIDLKTGKESVTYFHVLKRFRKDDATLISCRLLTGRTHQIRVHMEYIGHPVIGDPLYGEGNRKIAKDGQLLHAFRLTFIHPKTKKEVSFEAPLPDQFEKILQSLS